MVKFFFLKPEFYFIAVSMFIFWLLNSFGNVFTLDAAGDIRSLGGTVAFVLKSESNPEFLS